MTRTELSIISDMNYYEVHETYLFGKHYAWIRDPYYNWSLEKIDEQ